jgi:demethoxyubiquinone hydroxylase (CLK1/Coq7/Cat5 family)
MTTSPVMADHERAAISMAADEEGAHRSAFDSVVERRIDRPGIPATALESHSMLTCFLGISADRSVEI